jgi:hypothetical protein
MVEGRMGREKEAKEGTVGVPGIGGFICKVMCV